MRELELIAKLAEASKQQTGNDYAVLMNSFWTPLAIGTHPATDTKSTAHSAIVNILQNHPEVRATYKLLVTYKPTSMCEGMLNNFKSSDDDGVTRVEVYAASSDALQKGDDLDITGLDLSSAANLLKSVGRLRGNAAGVVQKFNEAPKYLKRRDVPAPHRTLLSKVPFPLPFRGARAKPQIADDLFMLVAFSLVALTWHDKNKTDTRGRKINSSQGGNNVGAVIVKDQQIISWGVNVGGQHATLHAETLAIQSYLERTGETALPPGCVIYSSLQPCHMCAGFIAQTCTGVRVLYGMQDNDLQTCLKALERPWGSQMSNALIEAVKKKKGSTQGASTRFLRDDGIREMFMPALEALGALEPKDPAEADLLMHCRELLLIVAEQGLATEEGFTHLLAMAEKYGAEIAENRSQRGEVLADLIVQNHRQSAHTHAKGAESCLSQAQKLLRNAELQLVSIQAQRDLATKAARDARGARDSAADQARTSEANRCAESAATFASKAEDAWLKAHKLRDALRTWVAEGKEQAVEAANYAELAMNAATVAAQEAEDVERTVNRPVVFFVPDTAGKVTELAARGKGIATLVQKADGFAKDAAVCLTKLGELLKVAELAVSEAEAQKRNAEDDVEQAKLIVEHKRALADFHQYDADALLTICNTAKKYASTAKEQSERAQRLLKEAGETVEGFTSPKALQEAKKSLTSAEQSAQAAQKAYEDAESRSQAVKSLSEKLGKSLENLKKASSPEAIERFKLEAQGHQTSLKKALQEAKSFQSNADTALKGVESHQSLALAPIKCSSKGCTATLTKATTNSTRWHACQKCGRHYCGSCGARLQYPGYLPSATRKCGVETCGGTTELL